MKLSTLALIAQVALTYAHYSFPVIIHQGVAQDHWRYVRKWHSSSTLYPGDDDLLPIYSFAGNSYTPPDRQNGSFYTLDMRCNAHAQNAPETLAVKAGDNIGFVVWDVYIFHPGPLTAWMAKVPEGKTAATWDGDGKVWFKISEDFPYISTNTQAPGGKLTWPNESARNVTFKIPPSVPNGEYLFRVEHLALHAASTPNYGGPQWFISCAQIAVSGGGTGTPAPLVAFPGAYDEHDPIFWARLEGVDKWNFQYQPYINRNPGPVIWKG